MSVGGSSTFHRRVFNGEKELYQKEPAESDKEIPINAIKQHSLKINSFRTTMKPWYLF